MNQVTVFDVAKQAQCSIATVSRALNNEPYVRADVKEKVLAAVKKLNYVPNIAARNLSQGRTKTIGLILPDSSPIYTKRN